MCTAITYKTKDHYFGRNLDLAYNYNETVTITPRHYPFTFREQKPLRDHYAMIGMATVVDDYPLFYDATNECGLSIAALNFPQNAVYFTKKENRLNLAPFELIPWFLGQYQTVEALRQDIAGLNIIDTPFNDTFALTPLHWFIADKAEAAVLEQTASGLRVYDDPAGVLTNSPPFDYHMNHLCNYLNLTNLEPTNRFTDQLTLSPYSYGMGAVGLPGDLSSSSRFIRAAFTKLNSVAPDSEEASISQFFHILGSVAQQRGCVKIGDSYEKTVYTSCCNTDKGIYYYTTYENSQISGVSLFHEDLETDRIYRFPLAEQPQIYMHN